MRIVCLLVLLSLIGGCSHSVTLQERAEQEAIFIQEFRQEFAKRLRYPLFAPGDEIPEADVMVFFRFASSSGRISSCRVQYGAGNDKSKRLANTPPRFFQLAAWCPPVFGGHHFKPLAEDLPCQ
ncbi:hypothetical protein ACRCPZ_33430, partial [Pseudomonas aeruginosa]